MQRSKPRLLGTATSHAINASLIKKLPYDPAKDFAPIALVAVLPQIIVIHPALPATSLKDFIALAKKRPGEILFGSPGNGSNNQLGAEMLNIVTGIKTLHVPYKGAGPAITDLLGGQVQLMFNSMPSVLPLVRSGKLKGIAVGSAQRCGDPRRGCGPPRLDRESRQREEDCRMMLDALEIRPREGGITAPDEEELPVPHRSATNAGAHDLRAEPVSGAEEAQGGEGEALIVLSGGAAALIEPRLNAKVVLVDNLVLEGVLAIARDAHEAMNATHLNPGGTVK